MNNDLILNSNELLTTKEVAKMLNISESKLAQLRLENYNKDKDGALKSDFLPFVKFGTGKRACVRYKKSEVLAYIEKLSVTA